MGLIEFVVLAVVAVVIGWLAIYVLSKLTPGHPVIIDNLIWLVVVLVIVITLVRAMGLMAYDPQIPRVR